MALLRVSGSSVQTGASLTASTVMLRVTSTGARMPSLALRVKLFTPMSAWMGVPERVPSAAMVSHAGPLIFVKVSASPPESVAELARLAV